MQLSTLPLQADLCFIFDRSPNCARNITHIKQRKIVSTFLQVQPFSFHKIEPPSNKVETSVAELKSMYHTMYRFRRMEIAADMMYKAKLIRGFCHL